MVEGHLHVDMGLVKARKDALVRQSSEALERWLENTPNLTLIRGHARLEGNMCVRVNESRLHAPQIFLDVGGRAVASGIEGLTGVRYSTTPA
jgi:pyruvate/2-oxoglutarate dehydrogenase complex dihydrolipoamide dehydrogenase (E3) component